jgi:phage terminase small subunit
MAIDKETGLTDKQRIFCESYIFDWNGTKAYKKAYPNVKDTTAAVEASKLLRKPNIEAYIEEIQKDIFKLIGVSALRNAQELKNIAYSNLRNYHSNWMTLEDWDKVSVEDKAAISEMSHVTTKIDGVEKVIVKFKLHPKQPALDSLNKMLGKDGIQKIDLTTNGESLNLSEADREKRIADLLKKAGK